MTRLFLCGDVMTGRGIDQILPRPSAPAIFERWCKDARDYVLLAERRNGPVPRRVPLAYPWGEALRVVDTLAPDVRIANLETSVTTAEDPWPKGINYRMHPDNVGCLTAARLDVCVLANNHVLDFGHAGLRETLSTLRAAGLRTCGAGRNRAEATAPAVVDLPRGGRVLVFATAEDESGVPEEWAARADRSGVSRIDGVTPAAADRILADVSRERRPGDIVVVSVHWGGNWGYEAPSAWTRFAHRLVDGGVDVVFGHSSHHPRPVEIYRDRPILYGAGDFLNDYEGISGHEAYRGDLMASWIVDLTPEGALLALHLLPFRMRNMRLELADDADRAWLAEVLERASRPFGTAFRDDGRALVVFEAAGAEARRARARVGAEPV